MVRSVLGILGGYIVMALVVGLATAIAVRRMLGVASSGSMPRLTTSYLAVNLTYSALAAILAGVVCALIAGRAPIAHSVILGVLVFAMSLWSMRVSTGQPRWYQVTLAVGMPLLIVVGGMLSVALHRTR